jgi:hypothetical protein
MCQAVQYRLPIIVAFNYFFNNQTCQLIPNNFTISALFYLAPSINSTVLILNQTFISRLTSKCCADVSWVISQIQQSNTFRNYSTAQPLALTLDTDRNLLIVIRGVNSSFALQPRDLTVNMTLKANGFIKKDAQPVSYHQGLYYIGITRTNASLSNTLYTYNISYQRSFDITLPNSNPQRAVWLNNGSLMCVIMQNGYNSSLAFLNWNSTSLNFTYNRVVSVPFNNPYGLAKSNDDTMIYVSGNLPIVYQISVTTFIWSILVPNNNSTEVPMSLTVDSCGNRLWVLMLGFGIRIYDRFSGIEIASWNMSANYPTLYDMVLTPDYDLYLIDYSMNQVIRYGSSLTGQCTVN